MIGKTIYTYEYEYRDGSGVLDFKNNYTVENNKVIAENEGYFVVDSNLFATYSKSADGCLGLTLDSPYFRVKLADKIYGTNLDFVLHSETKHSHEYIKQLVQSKIDEKFAFLGNVDLSVIGEVSA